MISPLQNKSRDQLLAEFDTLFGGYNLTPQKPTTSRGVGFYPLILFPSEIKISDILGNLGRPLGERYILILSSFYFRGLFRKKVAKQLGNYLAAHSESLRKLGGESYKKLLDYGLKEEHLIKSPKSYVVGKQTYEYMLNQKVFSLKTQRRYELTTKAAIRIWKSHPTERRNEFVQKGAIYQKIASSIDGLIFDYAAAMRYVASLPDGEPKNHRRNIVEQLMCDGAIWSHDRQGRNYTIMVVIPRDIRRYFSHSAGPLHVVDVRSCHALLHLHLYPNQSSEEKKYRYIVENGRFWEFMNDAAGKPFNLSVPNQKDELKTRVLAEVFYSHPAPKAGVKRLFAVTFKNEFPILWSEIDALKVQNVKKAAGPVSRLMLTTESEIVSEAMKQLQNKPYPLITIHDSIVTTKAGLADVRQALQQAFAQVGLRPSLREELLTI